MDTSVRRPTGFLLLYALANIGGVIGYLPLLTLLLPIKVDAVAGEARIGVFTATVIAGALAASGANILFGWLSDRSVARGGGRRRWLAGGVVATALSYGVVAAAASPVALVVAVVLFQVAVNAMLAPLFALMADEVPDAQKGVVGGMLAMGNPVASALSAGLVALTLLDETARLAIVPVLTAACIAPLLLARGGRVAAAAVVERPVRRIDRDLVFAWSGRLFVQVAGNVLVLYLLYYLQSVSPDMARGAVAARVGGILTIAYIVPLPVAVLVGRLSDRSGRRKPFLLAAAIVAAAGLVGMALADGLGSAAIAFGIYTIGSAVFLSLHSAFAMQLLPSVRHRGRDLGLLNLTNTLPALLGPLLTWALATPHDFDAVMLVLAALTLGGGLVMLGARGHR